MKRIYFLLFSVAATLTAISASAYDVPEVIAKWQDTYQSADVAYGTHGFIYNYGLDESKKIVRLQIFNGSYLADMPLGIASIAQKLEDAVAQNKVDENGHYVLEFPYQDIDNFTLILDAKSLDIVAYKYWHKKGKGTLFFTFAGF